MSNKPSFMLPSSLLSIGLLSFSAFSSQDSLAASRNPDPHQTLIQNIWDDLKREESLVWKVSKEHGHGYAQDLSEDDISFLKEDQNCRERLINLLEKKEEILQANRQTILQQEEIFALQKRLRQIKRTIEKKDQSLRDLCKDHNQFYKSHFIRICKKLNFNDLILISIDRSEVEEETDSIATLVPKQACHILEGEWINKDSKSRYNFPKIFTGLSRQSLNVFFKTFSEAFPKGQDPLVLQPDLNNLQFILPLPEEILSLNLSCPPKIPEGDIIHNPIYFSHFCLDPAQHLLVQGRIEYGNFFIQSCTPLPKEFTEFTEQTPSIPLSQFLATLKAEHPEPLYFPQENYLEVFSQQLAQHLTKRFVLIYLQSGLFFSLPQFFLRFNELYQTTLTGPAPCLTRFHDMLKALHIDSYEGQHIQYTLSLGGIISLSHLSPPFRSPQEYQTVDSYLATLEFPNDLQEENQKIKKFLPFNDFVTGNEKAHKRLQDFGRIRQELAGLQKQQQQIEDQLNLQKATEKPAEQLKRELKDLDNEIMHSRQFLLQEQCRANTLIEKVKTLREKTCNHFLGKLRKTITNSLINMSSLFSLNFDQITDDQTDVQHTTAVMLEGTRIISKFASYSTEKNLSTVREFQAVLEFRISQHFPISKTSNFSSAVFIQTTNKITIVVIHDTDGNILRYVTAYPSPGKTLFELDKHQDQLLIPDFSLSQPLPTEEHPSQQTPRPLQKQNLEQIQSKLEEKVAQLSPEEQALWAAMTEEPQSKKGKQKKQGKK